MLEIFPKSCRILQDSWSQFWKFGRFFGSNMVAAGETPTLPEACGCYFTAIFMFSLPILATTIEPDCAAKDVVPLMAVAEPRALPSMP